MAECDPVAQPPNVCAKVAGRLCQMDCTDAWYGAHARRAQQVETIFQVLFINVNDIWAEICPVTRNPSRDPAIKGGGKRTRRMVIRVCVASANDLTKTCAPRSQLVHTRMIRNPHHNLMAANAEFTAKIINKNLAAPARART